MSDFPTATAEGPATNSRHDHAVQFYEDDSFLTTVVAEFLATGFAAGEPIVVIATPAHRRAFMQKLESFGVNARTARDDGQVRFLDARRTLARFTHDGAPDRERFLAVMGEVIRNAQRGREGLPVRAYGEMVDLLWKDGHTEGAIALECLWNELATRHRFSLLCAYSIANFCYASDADAFQRICEAHRDVSPTERYSLLDERQQLNEVTRLQQRARLLEAEVRHRESVEQRLREAVAALRAREAELGEREADLRDVLENAAEGIHLVAADGTIQWANDAELELFGYTAEEYIGRNVAEFHVDAEVIQDILARLAGGETLRGTEVRVRHKDGSIRYVMINSNVRWRDGRFLHTRCFTRDVTELHHAADGREAAIAAEHAARLEAELARDEAKAARAHAEQANRAKSDFLAIMSHELRTPLNAIGGYVELMELGVHGAVTQQQREVLERVRRNQRVLLGHINQVLNYARIEAGTVTYDVTDVNVPDVIRATHALIAPQMQAHGLKFELAPRSRNAAVRADPEKLQQVLLNLLTNAVKFTDRGGRILIDVEATAESVHIHVSDSGIGIPQEKLLTIFEPFVQIDSNYTRTREGVGLGLAISRDLVRGMAGNLAAKSEEGVGSTFTITLPRGTTP